MTSRARNALAAPVVILAVAICAAGCGLGPGAPTGGVSVTVTRGFGTARVGALTRSSVPGSETVMRMLERSFRVQTRYGGGFVESIDGLSGGSSRLDWFYYVNGVEAPAGAASTSVHRGDRIWWDLHDWSATDSVPAVVGSFPEPFVHGIAGRRVPTVLECGSDVATACHRVASALSDAGVPAATQVLGVGSGSNTLTVAVGTWSALRATIAAKIVEAGPSASGVYARFVGPGGQALALLDPHGRPVRTLGAGTGLVAATDDRTSEPTWLITGTDAAGVSSAAAALTARRLRDHFALAVHGGTDLAVPVQAAR